MAALGGANKSRGRGRGRGATPPMAPGTPPGFGGPRPGAAPQGGGRGQRRGGGKAGIGGQAMAGPGGRQLQARVSSGAITQEQAQKTMQQRQTLQKAFGSGWRDKLSGGGKSFAGVNKGLKANPKDPTLAALRKKLIANRSSMLTTARAKNKGAGKGKDKKAPAGEGGE